MGKSSGETFEKQKGINVYSAVRTAAEHPHKGRRVGGGSASAKPDSVVMKEAANAKRSPPSAGFLPLNQN